MGKKFRKKKKQSLRSVKEIITSIQRSDKSFIDGLLKANDDTLLNAEGMIVATPQPDVFDSTFTNKITSHKSFSVRPDNVLPTINL